MKILWHKRAVAQLYQVEEYVLRDFGERIRQEFMDEVEQVVLSLAETPTMGKIDPLFAHRKQTYRSIIVRRKIRLSTTSRMILLILLLSGTHVVSLRIRQGKPNNMSLTL
jgi:plasmid stabilization system protein ParE